jgi:hypothetical protein
VYTPTLVQDHERAEALTAIFRTARIAADHQLGFPTGTKAMELPIPEAGVRPTPDARVLPAPETSVLPTPQAGVPTRPANLQAAGRPPAHKEKASLPRPDHIVVVILENKHRSSIIGRRQATYLNLAAKGAPT